MTTVTRVGVLSLAKLQTVVMALLGAPIGALFFWLSLSEGAGGFSVVYLVVFPVVYAAGGFLLGVIGAWLYNLAASWVGGVQIVLREGDDGGPDRSR